MAVNADRDRARALAVAGDFGPEALTLNLRLVAEEPGDIASRTRLARCYRQAGRLAEAEAEYREALRFDPKNKIAAGGLESLKPPEPVAPAVSKRATLQRARPHPTERHAEPDQVPQSFSGFRREEFAELRFCPDREVQPRFAPRVVELLRRINALPSSVERASIRDPEQRHLFRIARAEVHPYPRQWCAFNLGGRFEPQFNLGMSSGNQGGGDWFRIGLGFDLSLRGKDPDMGRGQERVRTYLRRFQTILTSDDRYLFTGFMGREDGLIQVHEGGPRRDLAEPARAAEFIAQCSPEATDWVFCGKWLSPERAEDATILSDPVALVRTIERVFAGLQPLYRTLLK